MSRDGDTRGATPVVGNILLVAIVIIIAITVVTLSFTFLDRTGTPTGEASFSYEQTAVGLRMTPQALGTDVIVKLNDRKMTTIEADAAGESVLLPTAPGDRILVITKDEDKSVLVNEKIDDRSEVGDFVAYYTFDSGSGTTLEDRSNNDNTGTINGNPTWQSGSDSCLRFDGSNDYVTVEDISAPVDVDAFTVAVAYRQREHHGDGTGNYRKIDQLIEHRWSGNEWFLETKPTSQTAYGIHYAVNYPNQVIRSEDTGDTYQLDDRHVAIATYDGNTYELYVDGDRVQSKSFQRKVDMGDMKIGRDFEDSIQYFEGDICEIRLYYAAFSEGDVEATTTAMS